MSERLVLEQLEPTLPSHYYFDAEHHAPRNGCILEPPLDLRWHGERHRQRR